MAQSEECTWIYCGPIFRFEKLCDSKWTARTTAVSEKKALSNLSYRAKNQMGLGPGASIRLDPKYLTKENSI